MPLLRFAGVAHARRQAIALQPDNPRAHLASAVALGRLALWSPNQRKIELSRTVRERVITCLALSPDDDVALHVLGRWEYEMCCVGFAVRLIIKSACDAALLRPLLVALPCPPPPALRS